MSHALQVPPPGFEDLSVEEQIEYIHSLWEVLAARPDRVPVPQWHREILDERLVEFERDPEEGSPWEELRAELDAEARQR